MSNEWQRRFPTGGKSGGPMDYTGNAADERRMLSREDDEPDALAFGHVKTDFGDGKTSRRTRLTPQNVETMKLLVAGGTPITTACTAIGAGKSWNKWGRLGREAERNGVPAGWDEGESPERYWLEQMDQAKAAFETSMIARIGAAAVTDWRAASWLLERRAPQRWWPKHKLDMHVNGNKAVSIETMSMEKVISMARGMIPDGSDIKVFQADLSPNQTPREVVEGELVDDD